MKAHADGLKGLDKGGEVPEAEAEKLLRLMVQADGGQPQAFMTPKAAAAMGAFILAELAKIAARAEEAPSIKPEWGTVGQVATIYSMTAARVDDILAAWVAAGKVRVIAPVDPVKQKEGYRRYNLADVAACMETAPSPSKKGVPGRKGARA